MDNISKKVKDAFNHSLPGDSVLSEYEKQKIRNRIISLQPENAKRKLDIMPKLLTVLLAAGFILFIGGMIEKEFYLDNSSSNKGTQTFNQTVKKPDNELNPKQKVGNKINVQGDILTQDGNGHLLLSTELQEVYNTFSKTYQDDALENLPPLAIFTIYFYAEEQKDFKSQYALFIKDPDVDQTFKTYEEFEAAVKQPGEQASRKKLLETIKSAHLQEEIRGESKAYILISKDSGLGFGLTKNKKGIWKVNWMPIQ